MLQKIELAASPAMEQFRASRPLPQVVGLAVVARGADRMQRAGPQRGQIIHDGAGRPGARADRDDLVGPLARFDARLGQARIDFEILVEEEIAEDGDAPRREFGEQLFQAVAFHDLMRSRIAS